VIIPGHERISVNLAIRGGEPCLRSTRLLVSMFRNMMLSGNWSDEAILSDYPRVTQEDLDAIRAFCADAGEPWVSEIAETPESMAKRIAENSQEFFEHAEAREGSATIRIVDSGRAFDVVVTEVRG
jgi:uncharacterized protein (DUF433 family)